MKIEFQGSILSIDKAVVEMPFPIQQLLLIGEKAFVRVDSGALVNVGDHSLNRNVYAFDKEGNQLWQIQESPHGGTDNPKPYMALHDIVGKLVAYNWIGVEYVVDLNIGTVQPYGTGKRPW